jgi:hypothetical protein
MKQQPLLGKVQQKPMTRFTGEHSLQSAGTFAAVQANIGLIVGEDTRPERFRKSVDDATEGAQTCVRIVREENNGLDVYPKQPGLNTSIDDSTVFAHESKATVNGDKEWVLQDPDTTYAVTPIICREPKC